MDIKRLDQIDVLVIGGGLAAMNAAICAEKLNQNVMILSKSKVGLSGSSLVSMSVHRYAPQEPSLREEYRLNFLASGKGINNSQLIELLIEQGANQVESLESYGLPLLYKTMNIEGKPYRYLACCDPKYGQKLTAPMRSYIETKTSIKMLEGYMALELVVDKGKVSGVIVEKDNNLYFLVARAIVLATGGAGYVYNSSSNTSDLTGDGYAMALNAGLELRDMEFIQFYPYRIYSPRKMDIFPDIFSHGACYLNERGERFMSAFPKKELENRDVLARCMYFQEEVILDLSKCDKMFLASECPNIYKAYNKYKNKKFLVKPVAHFMMGGIPLRPDCSTNIAGLYCCGEVTGGLHGANRLAGSALTEAAVFAPIAGNLASDYASQCVNDQNMTQYRYIDVPVLGEDDVSIITHNLRETMWYNASLVRTQATLNIAIDKIEQLEIELANLKPASLRRWWECKNLITTAKCILRASLLRQESRGAYYREDFPNENCEFVGNFFVSKNGARFIPSK